MFLAYAQYRIVGLEESRKKIFTHIGILELITFVKFWLEFINI